MTAVRLSAEWLLPIDGVPVRWGAVLVGADGRIVAAGPDHLVPHPPAVPEERLPGVALLPGLVNAHTHLELTGFDGLVPEADFPAWVRRVRALKAERSTADFRAAARRGIADCRAAGITTVADTGDSGAVIEALHAAGGSGIAYQEVFGPDPGDAPAQLAALQARVAELRAFTSPRVRLGVSPHAPYTVSGPLYAAVAAWCAAQSLPLAVHLAESREETQLLATRTGGFAEALATRGIALPDGSGHTPVEWLELHGVLGARTLCIHVVQANTADIARLGRHACAVAHCPRSNRRHGHGDAPLVDLLAAGLPLGVGTDSVASVAPLDLLAEARAARGLGRLSAAEALQLITSGAARAIGMAGEVGTIAPGAWADVIVVRLPGATDAATVEEAVLADAPGQVVATYQAGLAVYRRAA